MYSVAFFPLHNPSDEPVLLLHSTQFGSVTLRPDLGVSQGEFTVFSPSESYWEGVDGAYALAAEEPGELHLERVERVGPCQDREGVAEALPDAAEEKSAVSLRSADANERHSLLQGLRSFALPMTVEKHRNYHDLPLRRAGPHGVWRTWKDWDWICHNPMIQGIRINRGCPLRTCSPVWTRNAKTPSTAVHPLTQVRIATGSNPPIRQKAYPIPHTYVEAVRAEVNGLLKAGLIEPDYSNWYSPILCVVKKDTEKGATGKDIRLKIAVDFRKLNAATELDTGSLGDQGDFLETFHNRPYNSLCVAAGGYYQCETHPSNKHKTCFVLPMSGGGTTFV
eukprot:36902-Pleurochrysis_carterae.AAC.1